ncbi:MAG: hypothetical protein LWX56_03375 [Ignavibacteria bacterium]|nr:hypothetical protein [Ignavibacteria bacterium]
MASLFSNTSDTISIVFNSAEPLNFLASNNIKLTFPEMLFAFAEQKGLIHGIEDINGRVSISGTAPEMVLGAYILNNYSRALQAKSQIVKIAETIRYCEYTNEDALKTAIILEHLCKSGSILHHEIQEKGQLSIENINILSNAIENPDEFDEIWEDEMNTFSEGEISFDNRLSVFSSYSDCNVTVIETDLKLHPVTITKQSQCSRILLVQKVQNGRYFSFFLKPRYWFSSAAEQKLIKEGLESLAAELNQMNCGNAGRWQLCKSSLLNDSWDIQFCNELNEPIPSPAEVYEIENIITNYYI